VLVCEPLRRVPKNLPRQLDAAGAGACVQWRAMACTATRAGMLRSVHTWRVSSRPEAPTPQALPAMRIAIIGDGSTPRCPPPSLGSELLAVPDCVVLAQPTLLADCLADFVLRPTLQRTIGAEAESISVHVRSLEEPCQVLMQVMPALQKERFA